MSNSRFCLLLIVSLRFLLTTSNTFGKTVFIEKQIDTIYSSVLNQKRIAWIHSPKNSNKRVPVVYVLDGEINFDLVVNTINQLKLEMIVVGVAFINPGTIDVNAERTRDYTPTHVNACPNLDSNSIASSGGGKNFIKFLQTELIPYIESKYPASTSRTLIGHSFGGLTAMNVFHNNPDLFDSYLAIDPSMWWDDMKLLKEIKASLERKNTSGKKLFVAVANSKEIMLKEPSIELSKYFDKWKKTLAFGWKYYPDNDHGSVVGPAINDGIKFLLETSSNSR